MKQSKKEIRIVLTISLSILFMTIGCGKTKTIVVQHPSPEYRPPAKQGPPPWAPAHGYRAKYQYYYYPSSYIYFDTKKKLYFYLEGGNWRVAASLPMDIKLNVSDYVALEMDTDKPYQFHSDVVKKYPPGQQKEKVKKKGKDKDKSKKKGKGKDKEK